jgi:hypothetical protein
MYEFDEEDQDHRYYCRTSLPSVSLGDASTCACGRTSPTHHDVVRSSQSYCTIISEVYDGCYVFNPSHVFASSGVM